MKTLTKKRIKKNLKEIEREIKWYNPPKKIVKAMQDLGKIGFEFSGHGVGMSGEDFGLTYDLSDERYIYANLAIPAKHCSVSVDDTFVYTKSYSNTIKRAKKLIKKYT